MWLKRMAPAVLTLAALAPFGGGSAAAQAGRNTGSRAPRLDGLTFEVARARAFRAGCLLRVKGAHLERAYLQTIVRQAPARGGRSRTVTVWLNPFCRGSGLTGPAIQEPSLTPGPTGLVSGFYLVGGPASAGDFSAPHCVRPEPLPGPGTVEVLDGSGAVVATGTSKRGRFARIALAAGTYTIRGLFTDATINGVHPTQTKTLVIPAGDTVRQDFFLSIP